MHDRTHSPFANLTHTGAAGPVLTPGAYVRHPSQPDWGLGQVQSVVGTRVTVNFTERGKLLIDIGIVPLETVDPDEA